MGLPSNLQWLTMRVIITLAWVLHTVHLARDVDVQCVQHKLVIAVGSEKPSVMKVAQNVLIAERTASNVAIETCLRKSRIDKRPSNWKN